jgi:hypothetical protein
MTQVHVHDILCSVIVVNILFSRLVLLAQPQLAGPTARYSRSSNQALNMLLNVLTASLLQQCSPHAAQLPGLCWTAFARMSAAAAAAGSSTSSGASAPVGEQI